LRAAFAAAERDQDPGADPGAFTIRATCVPGLFVTLAKCGKPYKTNVSLC